MITITAFQWVPPNVQGLVRDLRVRWALEEAGLDYHTQLRDPTVPASADYRAHQPFGQVPAYEEDGLVLFESGAIVLHIAQRCDVLLPAEPEARARAVTWMFAALTSIEIAVVPHAEMNDFHRDKEWPAERRAEVEAFARKRLRDLAAWLGDREYLEGKFTAGDLLMSTVLRIPRGTDLLDAEPTLKAYKERCEARPAFIKALADQMAPFAADPRA
jgi:glutathione S-transferase